MMILPTEEEKKKKANAGGSQFADVSAYLSQNKPQAQRLASSIGQNVVQAGNQARQSLGNTQNTFNQQLQTSRVPYNENLANRAATDPRSFYSQPPPVQADTKKQKSGPGGNRGGNQFVGAQYLTQGGNPSGGKKGRFENLMPSIAQQPQAAPNPQDVLDFQKMRDAQYKGPMDLTGVEGYQDAVGQEANAADMTQNLGNEIGLQDLLANLTGRSSNPLDQALLGGSQAQGILQNSGLQNADIPGMTNLANENAMTQATGAQTEADNTRGQIDKSIYGPQGALPTLQEKADQKGGGKGWKQNQAQYQQTLEALNKLMGTDYQYGGV